MPIANAADGRLALRRALLGRSEATVQYSMISDYAGSAIKRAMSAK
jgi:hypothetical protein